jgi:hypothetical protein
MLLSFPSVQDRVKGIAVRELENRMKAKVNIERVNLRWLNRIELRGLTLADSCSSPVVEAGRLIVDLDPLPLLRGRVMLTAIRLMDFSVHIYKETPESMLNLQFILDAFARKENSAPSEVDFSIRSVLLRRGNIMFDIINKEENSGRFDPNHIDISGINGHIALEMLGADSLNIRIRRFAAREKSGLEIKNILLRMAGNRDSLAITELAVEMPHSLLRADYGSIALHRLQAGNLNGETMPVVLALASSEISPKDIAPVLPALANYDGRIRIAALMEGNTDEINLRRLSINDGEKAVFAGRLRLGNITNPAEMTVDGAIDRLALTTDGIRNIITGFNSSEASIPYMVERLGTIRFNGHVSGQVSDIAAEGRLSSDIGSIEANLRAGRNADHEGIFLKGTVSSSELMLNELFNAGNRFGAARFSLAIDASGDGHRAFAGTVSARINEFDYLNYRYENLKLDGRFRPDGFNGKIEIDDPNFSMIADGMFSRTGTAPVFDFSVRLNHFRPDNLNLWDKLESPDISGSMRANFTGSNIDDMNGSISMDSLRIHTDPSDFFLRKITLETTGDEYGKSLRLESDIAHGEVSGIYSFSALLPGLANTVRKYLPAFIPEDVKESSLKENNFSINLSMEETRNLAATLKLPFSLADRASVTGYYNSVFNKFKIEADIPRLSLGKIQVEDCRMICENPLDRISFRLDATGVDRKLRNRISIYSSAANNRIESLIHWENNKARTFKTDISAITRLSSVMNPEGKPVLNVNIHVNNSPLILNDTVWQIHDSNIAIEGDRISIDRLSIAGDDRSLLIDGAVSQATDDTLALTLHRIELRYIFDILNIPVLEFGGEATGKFQATDLYHTRMIRTDRLQVDRFSFNSEAIGNLSLKSRWDEQRQGIYLSGNITEGDSAVTGVNGYIYPVGENEGLDLRFDASNLNLSFLNKYMKSVISDFKGRGTGYVRLFGSFDDVDLEGKAHVKDAGMGIAFLNTYYTLSDTVRLDHGHIYFRDAIIRDTYGNTSRLKEANLYHNYLHDLTFDLELADVTNMLVYNASERQNPTLHGKVFASGKVKMQGNESLIDFDISLISAPGTSVGLNFMGGSSATSYNFISFINKNILPTDETGQLVTQAPPPPPDDTETELRIKLLVEVTPDANIEMLTDPSAGDMIRGHATGDLRIEYGTRSDLKIYGALDIRKGNYNFSLQQFIRKDFDIREGGTVNFSGDPEQAQLDINAVHNLTANIGDLDPSLLGETPRTNISVNCVLHLLGVFHHPAISFDLELPGSNSDLERKVRSYMNTEDMLMRQIVYLLALNTFHPSGFAQGPLRSNEVSAMTSAAISSQISSLLSAITDKVKIGTNIRANQDRFNETEVDMLLSSQLFNNRLLFNGNFGYKNNVNVKNVFVGEFDLEYLLTRNGEFRLKAYNHANDMYRYLKQSLTTQGFGFVYKKDFSSISDLFGRPRRSR